MLYLTNFGAVVQLGERYAGSVEVEGSNPSGSTIATTKGRELVLLKLGAQVSIAGKIYSSLERAKRLGCNTMQIFARNPRQIRRSFLDDQDIKTFKDKAKKLKISPIAVHIPYTMNLASSKKSLYKITIREFAQDLIEADKLGADYLITHMGSHKGSTEERGLMRVAEALEKILEATKDCKTKVLLENTSGSGYWLGYVFSHHRFILEKLNWSKRIGICMDTAHAWAADYKIDDQQGLDILIKDIDQQVGLDRLKVIHLNDTKERLGSRHDRHCDIGKGNIGMRGFSLIVNHARFKDLPFILETPKESDDDDIRNLTTVRKIYKDDVLKRN